MQNERHNLNAIFFANRYLIALKQTLSYYY